MPSVSSHCKVLRGARPGSPGSRIASGVTTMRGGADALAADGGADVLAAEVAGAVGAADDVATEGAEDARAADVSPAARAVMQAKPLGLYIE